MLVLFEDDDCVRGWIGRLGSSGAGAMRVFKEFYHEVLAGHERFRGLNPSDIVEWQVNARDIGQNIIGT